MVSSLPFLLSALCLSLSLSNADLIAAKSTTKVQNTNTPLLSGEQAFNNAPELGPFFEKLQIDYKITTAVETGTFEGSTTAFFAKIFKKVHTIDISQEYYSAAKKNLASLRNVKFHLGSSESVLADLLPTLKKRFVLFYLDAHWNEYWPLLAELEEINKTHHGRCIIVIDDIKVPGRPDIPYDAYGAHECSFEYVKEKIENLFDGYTTQYLIPNSIYSRGKLVILPQ